jgi:gentisate 1,2-dioxygenase
VLSNTKIVSKIIGGSAERLSKGTSSPAIQETASSVYHIVDGTGYTEINGKKFMWKRGDTFCVPAWHKYQHFADKSDTAYLYRFDDKPMLKALGFYRISGMATETLVSD